MFTFVFRLILFIVSYSFLIQAANAGDLNGIRFWKDPEKTRLVFDLTDKIEYKLFTLDAPYRLVVDIKNTQLKVDLSDVEIPQALVKQIRSSKEKETLRIVIDLKNGITTKDFTLKPFQNYGHRLVVDLRDKNSKKQIIKTATHAPGDRQRDLVIAIDAGHGGEDPGAIGPKKTKEKQITLSVAKKLVTAINAEKGMKAVLTRTGDYYLSLRKRTDIARKHRADLFISLHADAFKDKKVKGASVWVLSNRGANSEIGRWLEQGEKSSDLAGGVDISSKDPLVAQVILDLSMHHSVGASISAAQMVYKAMRSKLPKMHKKSVQKASFVVLKMPDIPAMLVEMAFISNPAEEKALRTNKRQNTIVKSILSGVKAYFKNNPPDGTYYSAPSSIKKSKTLKPTPQSKPKPIPKLKAKPKKRTYRVKNGDTLSQLAVDFKVSMKKLKSHNKLKSDRLKIGQILIIPGS